MNGSTVFKHAILYYLEVYRMVGRLVFLKVAAAVISCPIFLQYLTDPDQEKGSASPCCIHMEYLTASINIYYVEL